MIHPILVTVAAVAALVSLTRGTTRLALFCVACIIVIALSGCAQLAPYAIDGGIWAPPAAHREAARREAVRQIERMIPAAPVPTDCDDLTRAGRADLCK